jgi:hypothetical protein
MSRWLTWWRALRLFVRHVPASPDLGEWTEAHGRSLRVWLKGDAGQVFQAILARQQNEVCRRAVLRRGECEYASGFAAGYNAAAALAETLAAGGQPEGATEENDQLTPLGGKALVERLAP